MQIITNNKKITLDDAQLLVHHQLKNLSEKLSTTKKSKNIFSKFFSFEKNNNLRGFYIYGQVGRGKSMLMKNFFHHLPIKNKIYFHFNDFMQKIHRQLHKLRAEKNADLIPSAIKNIIGHSALICLDEFQVEDVADAAILRKIFEYIFEKNIVVIFTSNSHPENLYQNGLQRDLFLEFVHKLLFKYCELINLDSKIDYRSQYLKSVKKHYFYPLNFENEKNIAEIFAKITDGNSPIPTEIEILGRKISIKKSYKNIAFFDFKELCIEALGAADYQAICQKFNIIFLVNIPKLSKEFRNEARRLILFIDEVYENKVLLIMSAEVPAEEIYSEGIGSAAFKRAASRINEITR
jgi:cell division protein ZapE